MGFQGSLKEVCSGEVFHLVLAGRKSGNLSMKSGGSSVTFEFLYGGLVQASGELFCRKLKGLLVDGGKLDAETVASLPDDEESLTEHLLRESGFSRGSLNEVRTLATKLAMWETFSFIRGEFEFQDVRPPRDLSDTGSNLSTADLLLEGIRQIKDDAVVERGLEGKMDVRIKPPNFAQIEAQMKGLKPDEGFILSRIDGTLTAEEICSVSMHSRDKTLRVLYALMAAGLIELDLPEASRHPAIQERVEIGQPETALSGESGGDAEIDLAGVGLFEEEDGQEQGNEEAIAPPAKNGSARRDEVEEMTVGDRKRKAQKAIEAGKEFLDRGAFAQAAAHLKVATTLTPKDPEAWYRAGQALAGIPGSGKKAEEALMNAIDLNYKNPEHYVALGLLYKKQGDLQRARVQFTNALHWDPSHSVAKAEIKKDGMAAVKDDLVGTLEDVKQSVNKVVRDVFRGRKR